MSNAVVPAPSAAPPRPSKIFPGDFGNVKPVCSRTAYAGGDMGTDTVCTLVPLSCALRCALVANYTTPCYSVGLVP